MYESCAKTLLLPLTHSFELITCTGSLQLVHTLEWPEACHLFSGIKNSPEMCRRVVNADNSVANVDTDVVKDHDCIQCFKHINAMVIKSKIKK